MSDCFVLYLLLTCMKKKTSGADKFTNNSKEIVDSQKSFKRITVAEPQGKNHDNSWHLHILLIFDVPAPFIARGNGFEHAVEMTGRLYTTLALFIQCAHKKETQNSANTYVQKSIEYISANYSYPITVEDIASYVGLSRSHLFRSFEIVMQQSPKEYLTDFRMGPFPST